MRILFMVILLTYYHAIIPSINKHDQLLLRSGNSIVTIGAFTYGYDLLSIRDFGQKSFLTIGKFSSFADGITIFLSGNHRTDWITTFPFEVLHHEYFHGEDITWRRYKR